MGGRQYIRRKEQADLDPAWRNLAAAVIVRARRDYAHNVLPKRKNGPGYVAWMIASANGFHSPVEDVETFLASGEFDFWIEVLGIDQKAVEAYIREGKTEAPKAVQHKHKART